MWVPSIYLMEGIPYFLVNTISVIMFARLGMPNDQMAFYTSLLYFPWFLKFLWSPIVDTRRTKRWWVLVTEFTMGILTIALALTIHLSYSLILALFAINAFCSATHDIAVDGYYMLALSEREQAKFVGIRSTFYRLAMIFGQGVLIVIAGILEDRLQDIPSAWSITLAIAAGIMLLIALYHSAILPHIERAEPAAVNPTGTLSEALLSFFRKPGVGLAIAFLLCYRLSEGLLVKITMPFMLDIGYSTATIGVLYGTLGVIALLLGGIFGGLAIARWGLKRSLWPMALSLTLPSTVYIAIAALRILDPYLAGVLIGFEQFGYGFGFAAYMLYMIHFSEGEYKTSHYAICTAFMALSVMIPGFFAGAIQVEVGYTAFFVIANVLSILTFVVTALVYKTLK